MIITAIINNQETEITIPDQDYWIKRNKKRTSKYWTDTDNLEKRTIKEYLKVQSELEKELYTFYGKIEQGKTLTYSQNRVVTLMTDLKPKIDDLFVKQESNLTKHLVETYKSNNIQGLYDFANGTNIYKSMAGVNEQAIKQAISYPWSGASFSDRIYDNKLKLVTKLKQEITSGLIRGDSVQQMSSSLAKVLNISVKNATRLIRTETAAVMTASDKATYKETGIDEYQYVATLDDRTSTVCQEFDLRVFKVVDMMAGLNAPPKHPNCRSTTVAYFNDFIGKRIAKDLETGKTEYIQADVNFDEWAAKYLS